MPFVNSNQNKPPEFVEVPTEIRLSLSGSIAGGGQSPNQTDLTLKLGGTVSGSAAFVLTVPPPILAEIDENAFAVQIYMARLLDENNQEVLITDASRDQPKGEIGERISLTIGKKDLSLVSIDKRYTFQIGTWSSIADLDSGLPPNWKTVCEDARLNTRSFSIGRNGRIPADSLSFDIIESSKNKLNYFPGRTYILFDSLVTSVNVEDIERTYTSDGDYIKTTVSGVPNLTVYKLFQFIKERCGFAGVETDILNFPILRADFPFDLSYARGLSPIGLYEPVFSVKDGNVLRVQSKFSNLPDDFEPRELIIDDYQQLNLQISASAHVDGIQIVYLDSNALADYYEDRLVQTREEAGTFGNSDYTRTDVRRTYRDWFENENPNVPLKTELVTEVHSTYNNILDLIGRETNNHLYDAQGKRTNSARAVESLVPAVSDSGTLALLTVREEDQSVFYTTDVQNPRRQFQSKTITQMSGLTAIDSENRYFNEDFKQDFLDAHKVGNLTADMTSGFGLLKTVTETLTPLGNNQFEVRTSLLTI